MEYQTALDFYHNRTGTVIERFDIVESLKKQVKGLTEDDPKHTQLVQIIESLVVQTNGLQADFLDWIKTRAELRTDAELCTYLQLRAPQVSNFRSNHLAIGDRILMRFHEITGVEIKEMKQRLCLPIRASLRKEGK